MGQQHKAVGEQHPHRADELCERWVGQDDFAAWCVLFEKCFAWSMPRSQWLWKYRDTTDRMGLGLFRGEALLAYYGGMPRRLAAEGAVWAGIQIGDVMVHPSARNGLTRGGPFGRLASSFLRHTLGQAGAFDLGFGFPNHRAMRLAVRLGLYREVDQIVELSWPRREPDPVPDGLDRKPRIWSRLQSRCEPAHPEDCLAAADPLWQGMRQALPRSILGSRDSAFLRARYVQHPAHHYLWFGLRQPLSTRLRGIGICRRVDPQRLEILDLIAHPDLFPVMAREIRRLADQESIASVSMWATRSHAQLFTASQPSVTAIDVAVPTCSLVPGRFPTRPDQRWWLTGGDTDFR